MRAHRRGFTLIELLIVVVIIGILAAIAIPKFSNTKGKAVVSAMRSDLRNLASIQEAFWVQNLTYYGGVIPDPAFNYQPTSSVTVVMVTSTAAGWSARATAPGFTPQTCAIYYGTAPQLAPATMEGVIECS